jgi:hypothetical protein
VRYGFSIFAKGSIAALGCMILLTATDAFGVARNGVGRPAAVVVNLGKKGDRLPMVAAPKARVSPSVVTQSASKRRPPFGCDAMFSAVADPAHAGLYRRCAA